MVFLFTLGQFLRLGFGYFLLQVVRGQAKVSDLLRPFRRPIAVLLAVLLFDLMAVIGFRFLIIPEPLVVLIFFAFDIALVDADLPLLDALEESLLLTRQNKLAIFPLVLLLVGMNVALRTLWRLGNVSCPPVVRRGVSRSLIPWRGRRFKVAWVARRWGQGYIFDGVSLSKCDGKDGI
jgi:hypothetical protein